VLQQNAPSFRKHNWVTVTATAWSLDPSLCRTLGRPVAKDTLSLTDRLVISQSIREYAHAFPGRCISLQ
jgi:hypothetical protein